MEKNPITRNVADFSPAERLVFERLLGRQLFDNQQLIIFILNADEQIEGSSHKPPQQLPDWCNVYDGLTDEQIAEIEKVILTRPNLSRTFD